MKKKNIQLKKKLSIGKDRISVLAGHTKSEEAAIPSCLPECLREIEAIPSCMPECY